MLCFLCDASCAPSRDSVLKDVERNYTATGFLDPDTFQVQCTLGETDRMAACQERLLDELVAYKEKYDREAYARRMHSDFRPFMNTAETADTAAAARLTWRVFYARLATSQTRLVFEKQVATGVEGVFRLRRKDLIYRVQNAE